MSNEENPAADDLAPLKDPAAPSPASANPPSEPAVDAENHVVSGSPEAALDTTETTLPALPPPAEQSDLTPSSRAPQRPQPGAIRESLGVDPDRLPRVCYSLLVYLAESDLNGVPIRDLPVEFDPDVWMVAIDAELVRLRDQPEPMPVLTALLGVPVAMPAEAPPPTPENPKLALTASGWDRARQWRLVLKEAATRHVENPPAPEATVEQLKIVAQEAAEATAKAMKDEALAVAQTQPPSPKKLDATGPAVWKGGEVFQVGDAPPFTVSVQLANVLGAAAEIGKPCSERDLESHSGVSDAARLLRALARSESPLAPFVHCPGKKNAGGYSVQIVKSVD